LTEDITTDKVFLISKDVIINGNNHKITSSDTRVFRLTTSDINVVMNDLNIVSRTKMEYPNDIRGIAIDANTQNIVLALNNCSVDFTDASACDWAYAVNIAGNTSGHALTINGGTYESANVINIWGQNHTINIDGATLTSLYAPNDLYYGACAMFNENESNVSTGNNMTIKNTTFNGTHAVAIENAGGEDNNVITANNTDNTKYYPVKAGETYYYTLAEAIGAIESEGTVKLLSSIKLEENVSINKNMTLDLNGKTIEGTDNATGSFGLIDMKPGFTLNILNNNINNEVGKITLTAKNNRAWNAYSSVVSNQRATLIVGENVVIEHLGGTDMAYGIDNLTNTGAEHAKTTINGATVKSTYRAIRQFLNSSAEGVNNELYVNSGVIEGSNKSIWMQDANAKANPGKLVVNEDAKLRGDVYLSVTEGSTEWPVEVSIAKAALQGESKVSTNDNVPENLILAEIDGIYTITARPYVATIGETGYYTLEAALADVSDGTVENAVIELAEGKYIMPEPTLKGKTFTIKGTKETVIDVSNVDARDQFVTGATLVFDGVTLNFGKVNYMGLANTASLAYKNCKINGLQFLFGPSVSFENCEFDSNGAEHCVWTYGAKNVSFTECNFTYGDRGINCYGDNDVDGGKQTVNFNECTFATENIQSKGAVEINSYYFSVGIEVNMEGCTAPAYGEMAYVSEWDDTKGAKTTINIK